MAREHVLYVRCDVCGAEEAAAWLVATDGKHWKLDLCEKHSQPILDVAVHGQEFEGEMAQPSPPPGRPGTDLNRYVRGVPDAI